MSIYCPDYNNPYDKELFDELITKKELTPEQTRFVNYMYHMQEYACGLDGDR